MHKQKDQIKKASICKVFLKTAGMALITALPTACKSLVSEL